MEDLTVKTMTEGLKAPCPLDPHVLVPSPDDTQTLDMDQKGLTRLSDSTAKKTSRPQTPAQLAKENQLLREIAIMDLAYSELKAQMLAQTMENMGESLSKAQFLAEVADYNAENMELMAKLKRVKADNYSLRAKMV
jgi:hypothetical protein